MYRLKRIITHFPTQNNLLQRITGSKMMSFLDGFSGYNQVWVNEYDRHKTTFTTPWGTFKYLRMIFGLINLGATFHRAMEYEFRYLMGIIEIYQEDLMVFSKEICSHVGHLRQVFERCCKYGISLNPNKSIFWVLEGKILGNIVSKDGVKENHERIKGIKEIPFPRNKKYLLSLFDKINFI
jgi:hypothetical protein